MKKMVTWREERVAVNLKEKDNAYTLDKSEIVYLFLKLNINNKQSLQCMENIITQVLNQKQYKYIYIYIYIERERERRERESV